MHEPHAWRAPGGSQSSCSDGAREPSPAAAAGVSATRRQSANALCNTDCTQVYRPDERESSVRTAGHDEAGGGGGGPHGGALRGAAHPRARAVKVQVARLPRLAGGLADGVAHSRGVHGDELLHACTAVAGCVSGAGPLGVCAAAAPRGAAAGGWSEANGATCYRNAATAEQLPRAVLRALGRHVREHRHKSSTELGIKPQRPPQQSPKRRSQSSRWTIKKRAGACRRGRLLFHNTLRCTAASGALGRFPCAQAVASTNCQDRQSSAAEWLRVREGGAGAGAPRRRRRCG